MKKKKKSKFAKFIAKLSFQWEYTNVIEENIIIFPTIALIKDNDINYKQDKEYNIYYLGIAFFFCIINIGWKIETKK